MKKLLAILLAFSAVASAQTTQPVYVRPSKGAALTPFATAPASPNIWAGFPTVTNANQINYVSPVYDWTAFEAVQIRVYGTGGVAGCTLKVAQYAVVNLGPFIQVRLVKPALSNAFTVQVEDAALKTGPWYVSESPNGSVTRSDLVGCDLAVTVVPLPFAEPENPTTAKDGTILTGGITTSIPRVIGGVDPATGRVTTVAVDGATRALKVDASAGGSVTVSNLPATLGQKTMAGSLAVVIASDQTALTTNVASVAGTVTVAGTVNTGVDAVYAPETSVAPVSKLNDNGVVYTAPKDGVLTLQNVGAIAVKCAINTTATLTVYSFILKGGTAVGDGLGGEYSTPVKITQGDYVSCVNAVAASGTWYVAAAFYKNY